MKTYGISPMAYFATKLVALKVFRVNAMIAETLRHIAAIIILSLIAAIIAGGSKPEKKAYSIK
jgi:hypothetical protein